MIPGSLDDGEGWQFWHWIMQQVARWYGKG